MAKRKGSKGRIDPELLRGAGLLSRAFPLLARLAEAGTGRDRSGNRRFRFSHYAALMLVGMFNPILQSARALVAASGLKAIRRWTEGEQVSLGSFSEAARVFDPRLLAGLVSELRSQFGKHQHLNRVRHGHRAGQLPQAVLERLVSADGSVLSALPHVLGRLGSNGIGQWRLHAQVRALSGEVQGVELTEEPALGERSEREVLSRQLRSGEIEPGSLLLVDRGYRSAKLYNTIHAAKCDYVGRLNHTDGRVVAAPTDAAGKARTLPALSAEARDMGIVADEWITLGGGCGASPEGTGHPVRRIRLVPPASRPSAARQGRVRCDRVVHDELVLATSLTDLPAEQIVMLYEYRWQVELFFRFLKQVLRCKQLLSAKTPGVQIQLYCALIAGFLMALATGGNPTRRNYERICLYFAGWADADELEEELGRGNHPPPR